MSPRESSRGHENVELGGGTWHLFFFSVRCGLRAERRELKLTGGHRHTRLDTKLACPAPRQFFFFLLGCQKRAGPESDQSEVGRTCRKRCGDCLSLEGGWVGGCRSYRPFIPLASDPNSREVGSPS